MKMNIIVKSLLNGIAGCTLLALLLHLFNGENFMQVLVSPNNIGFGVLTAVSSWIGYGLRKKEQGQH